MIEPQGAVSPTTSREHQLKELGLELPGWVLRGDLAGVGQESPSLRDAFTETPNTSETAYLGFFKKKKRGGVLKHSPFARGSGDDF